MYNYFNEMKEDVRREVSEYLEWHNLTEADIVADDNGELFEAIYDDLWVSDGVTGNGSGSYTFNAYQADEHLQGNIKLAVEAFVEFGYDPAVVYEKFANGESEYIDVTIRCYLLCGVLSEVFDEYKEEGVA